MEDGKKKIETEKMGGGLKKKMLEKREKGKMVKTNANEKKSGEKEK